jgi:hypothetical protein
MHNVGNKPDEIPVLIRRYYMSGYNPTEKVVKMARVFYGDIVSSMAGSVGSSTYSRNRYGQYKKNKPNPVNPNTARQIIVRSIFNSAVGMWQTLTAAQRTAWKLFADSVTLAPGSNRLDAMPEFVRCNTARGNAGLTMVSAAPTTFVNATAPDAVTTIPTFTVSSGLSLAYVNTNAALGEVGGAFAVFVSPPREATQNVRKGYRYAGKIVGSGTPPTSPLVISAANLPYTPIAGKTMSVRVLAIRADGRISSAIEADDVVA